MPLSYAELKSLLDVDEPDYPALATMAAGAMNHLRKLAASPDVSHRFQSRVARRDDR